MGKPSTHPSLLSLSLSLSDMMMMMMMMMTTMMQVCGAILSLSLRLFLSATLVISMIASRASRCYATRQTRRIVNLSRPVASGSAVSNSVNNSRADGNKRKQQEICIVGGGFGG